MNLYHYTVGACLPKIVEDREINCATAFLPPNVKPAVWFSTNPSWEETANKMVLDKTTGKIKHGDRISTMLLGRGLVRIKIDPSMAPYTWDDYKRLAGEDKKHLKALLVTAKRDGSNPESEWWVSFNPVGFEDWLSIEMWDGEKWQVTYSREK